MPRISYDPNEDYESYYSICIICGENASPPDVRKDGSMRWREQFRAVYRGPEGEVKLSGISRMRECKLWVPIDESARWDTEGADFIYLTHPPHEFSDFYIFHEICWNRFCDHFTGEKVDLERLYQALEYMPLLGRWSHPGNFGDKYEPFRFPTPAQLMQKSKNFPKPREEVLKRLVYENGSQTDCFSQFPLEIREVIATLLPTRDFLSLRYTSRAMGSVFTVAAFWRTKFDINQDRGFLHYMLEQLPAKDQQRMDWRLLYHCTSRLTCMCAFDVAVHSWERSRWLRDATVAGPQDMPLHFDGRALQHYHNTRPWSTQTVSIDVSRSLVKIAISVVKDRDVEKLDLPSRARITGMEFVFKDRPTVSVGTNTPGALNVTKRTPSKSIPLLPTDRVCRRSVDYSYPGLKYITNVKRLRGFHIIEQPRSKMWAIHVIRDNICCVTPEEEGDNPDHRADVLYLDEVSEVVVTFNVSRPPNSILQAAEAMSKDRRILGLGIRGKRSKRITKEYMRGTFVSYRAESPYSDTLWEDGEDEDSSDEDGF
ncbi:hypothetical protein ASPZODRAFT_140316 [Penicilliopsis zonata CBS 506.65]|uniref:F-box domain-containing protein n=1 Tax=Penicilliopsis zonata CBS 506.65 TaxID=1073090 RepID=A0A1L9SQB1_9EURO|nr:hypothetical protein ASPZODRAFT_140316 [Penicilliopsis zonata CBS 506.65]OJJ49415.1 hypothetical protein ASPZODRAFT_140316 [Penicilliopsis zonata CBS 506.65]